MSNLTELEKWPDHTELIFPCDAHDGDYLRVTWDADDPQWRMLWIEESSLPQRFRSRLVKSWKLLLGQRVEGASVVLSDESAQALREFLAPIDHPRCPRCGWRTGKDDCNVCSWRITNPEDRP